jgi:predicted phosphoribosyltransferase
MYRDRTDAGRQLAGALKVLAGDDPVVVGLARGGVVVASEVARILHAPLEVMVARKIGAPQSDEFAIGAIAPGVLHLDPTLVNTVQADQRYITWKVNREKEVMESREGLYRGLSAALPVRNRTIILVDDGLATGMTAAAAISSLRQSGAARVIVAAPVGSAQAIRMLARLADDVVCPAQPADFRAVGNHYLNFDETTDAEVMACLQHAHHRSHRVA